MRIQKINCLPRYTAYSKISVNSRTDNNNDYSYNPVAYRDYNITFGERLFRTPEDFYSCPFNKNGMPETMKQYLNADYEDRQHIPPQQMMALVFDDIKVTSNLEEVKIIYSGVPGYNPKEPLFENLTDTPNKKARTGILAEIDVMREDGKPLFKNGEDNLGHYILKKIYLEGKTLKEINEDFNKDKSVYYNSSSPIEYDTLTAYGIKFPNRAFWRSFTYNRENFNYIYTPKKTKEYRDGEVQKTQSSTPVQNQRKRFEGVKDWEIDKLADALNKGQGNISETRKQLKKSAVRDEAQLNFVAKYMGEINSVVLEKLHVSPEMSEFFENPDILSKSQKQKMDAYWQDSERRELRSTIMKDVIKLFFDAYGVDGQNDEFKELLDYAHSIKPARLEQQEKHNRIQAEYDELFAELDAQEKALKDEKSETEPPSYEELLQEAKKNSNVDEYEFDVGFDTIKFILNLQEVFEESLNSETAILPTAYAKSFIRFAKENTDDKYKLTKVLYDKGISLPQDNRLMSEEELNETKLNLFTEFNNKDIIKSRAAQQAVTDAFLHNKHISEIKDINALFLLDVFEYTHLAKYLPPILIQDVKADRTFINKQYEEYKRPLSNGEASKISVQIINLLRNYNPNNSIVKNREYYKSMNWLFASVSKSLNDKKYNSLFRSMIVKYLKEYGGSARFFLDKKASKDIKNAKLEQFLINCFKDKPAFLAAFAVLDDTGMEQIRIHDPKMYSDLLEIKKDL